MAGCQLKTRPPETIQLEEEMVIPEDQFSEILLLPSLMEVQPLVQLLKEIKQKQPAEMAPISEIPILEMELLLLEVMSLINTRHPPIQIPITIQIPRKPVKQREEARPLFLGTISPAIHLHPVRLLLNRKEIRAGLIGIIIRPHKPISKLLHLPIPNPIPVGKATSHPEAQGPFLEMTIPGEVAAALLVEEEVQALHLEEAEEVVLVAAAVGEVLAVAVDLLAAEGDKKIITSIQNT